ncbi:MAG: hypothetical protein IJU40_02840 [Desulfovibrionaceae bacterium]|nr:hypothetical protein [Desulfovibrionaceae bacterium]
MQHTSLTLPNYAADTSGVCSALYELLGLTVIHDASGCNSTYSTFDEPRWFYKPSAIYISGLTEMEAILGQESKFIEDLITTAQNLKPKFIALAGSPMPKLIGCDLSAIASLVEQETKIPSFAIPTNGMHTYNYGLSLAWLKLIETLSAKEPKLEKVKLPSPSLNLLGTSPLDLSEAHVKGLKAFIEESDFKLYANLSYDFGLQDLDLNAFTSVDVNLVVSESGLKLAKWLELNFKIPYVVGLPWGQFSTKLKEALHRSLKTKQSEWPLKTWRQSRIKAKINPEPWLLIGEGVLQTSLACALNLEYGINPTVLCPLEIDNPSDLFSSQDVLHLEDEAYFKTLACNFKQVVADPLYAEILSPKTTLYPWGQVAFSGRMGFDYEGQDLLKPSLESFLAGESYSC